MLQISLAMPVPEILISNGGLIRILLLSEIKMFHGIFTIIILSMSNQVPITTSNSFLLSHRVAMGASIGVQYFIRMYFNMLTVILYKTAMRYITHSM
jgi:hypothetical protein